MTYPPGGGQPDQGGYPQQPRYPAREYQGLQGYQQQQPGYEAQQPGFQPHQQGQQQPYFAPPPPPPKPKRSSTTWIIVGVAALIIAGGATWGVIALNKSNETPAAQPTSTGSQPTSETSSTPTSTSSRQTQAPSETKVVAAADSKTELSVPESWEEIPKQFQNEVAVIQQGDQLKEQYAMVIPANKADYNDFAGFVNSTIEDIKTSLENAEVGAEERLTIGGLSAAQYEVAATVTGTKIVYWFTMVEGKNGFYQVVGWTLPSRKTQNEPPIQEVIASFRER